ncbi:class I SAM-dependent methyltransferase [Crossiella cryophila]|uniref:Class I SAM-dependent methyltransferase n=1 Tax=Crossiella cryophila TaxID=43355 RepID=A0A7W7FQN1_9PSEU|nr:class I SAM-dependent methyltransferase [Crossiella cryophila]MBB4675141.1 hypothetical protein [Crossiella cryophila]
MNDSLARAMGDLAAWHKLAPLLTEYLPFGDASLRPSGLTAVLDEAMIGNRTVLLECGSGSSSVVVARMLARRGFGHLLSLEHDERWAAFVNTQLRREGLHQIARVVHTPLSGHPAAVGALHWYTPQLVHDEVMAYVDRFGLVDLLLVDGPPAFEPGKDLARYPALPVLRWALAPGATILLDDVDRPGELTVLTRWQEQFGLRFRADPTGSRLAIGVMDPG